MQVNEKIKIKENDNDKVSSLLDCSVVSAESTLLHGDCLELMKDISDSNIDMICCDMPYGATLDAIQKNNKRQWGNSVNCPR